MEHLMDLKMKSRQRARANGLFRLNRWPEHGSTKCKKGKAGEYSCENVDLNAFLSHQALGSVTREGNDVWGMCIDQDRDVNLWTASANNNSL